MVEYLVSKNYIESKHITKVSILYVENEAILVKGAFYSNTLEIKCKLTNPAECQSNIDVFIALLEAMSP